MSTWAIIPLKALGEAKRRLARALPEEARRRLVLAMLEEVLATVAATPAIERTLVVTPDPQVARVAARHGARVLNERPARGLNAAVSSGIALARAQGANRVLVLPADVPLATPGELSTLLAGAPATPAARVTIAPASDSGGTNALVLSPPDAIEPAFGPDSFIAHLSQAVARGLDIQVLRLPGLAADIDTPADLHRLFAERRDRPEYRFLEAHMAPPSTSPRARER